MPNSTIEGFWYINLGTSQAGRHTTPNPGPTAIGISLVQHGSALTTDKPVYGINTACEGPGALWSSVGGWTSAIASFVFESGALIGQTVTFTLNETNDVNDPTGGAHGEVMLTGNWNADGTMSGTLIDGCNANASSDWTASRTAGSISSIRAEIVGLNNIPRTNTGMVDIHMQSDGTSTESIALPCVPPPLQTVSYEGQLVVVGGPVPLQYAMSGDAFKGLTLNAASGRLTYIAPDCSELNKTGVIKLRATGAGGDVTSPGMSISVTVTR